LTLSRIFPVICFAKILYNTLGLDNVHVSLANLKYKFFIFSQYSPLLNGLGLQFMRLIFFCPYNTLYPIFYEVNKKQLNKMKEMITKTICNKGYFF
jgi:hypothetical protein